jgi:opacity protein-like surface antigen
MKRVALAAAMALALGGTAAKADMFDYAELQGGVTFASVDHDTDTGFNVGGALGWGLSPELALEADFLFTQSGLEGTPITDSNLESFTFMANLLWSFDMNSNWHPYIGVGLGGAQITVSDGTFGVTPVIGDSDVVFAWQAIIGANVPVAERISLLIEYRYQGSSDADLTLTDPLGGGIPISQDYQSHNLSAGFRFHL